MPIKDIAGQRFGMLVAIRYAGNEKWLFRCGCGRYEAETLPAGRAGHCGRHSARGSGDSSDEPVTQAPRLDANQPGCEIL
mgnify:CR=1 FL=1